MSSEWDQLMELSKEELVIELVKARRDMRNLRNVLSELSETGGSSFMYDVGSDPSEEWLDTIAAYAEARLEPGDRLCEADLEMYGVSEDVANRYIDFLRSQDCL